LALIEVSQMVSPTAAPLPAVGMGNIARRTFERRLKMIMRERVSSRAPWLGLPLIGVLALGVLPGWTQDPLVEKTPASPSASPRTDDPFVPQPAALSDAPSLDVAAELPKSTTPALLDRPVADTVPEHGPKGNLPLDVTVAETTPVAEAPVGREQQLQQLEARLAQLLDEVRTLRGQPVKTAANNLAVARIHATRAPYKALVRSALANDMATATAVAQKEQRFAHASQVQTLTRVRYQLSAETAQALAAFIEQWSKAEIDVKVTVPADANPANPDIVEGDQRFRAGHKAIANTATLVVTASEADQARIGAFIELLLPANEAAEGAPGLRMQ
jgi:hypothetical protein